MGIGRHNQFKRFGRRSDDPYPLALDTQAPFAEQTHGPRQDLMFLGEHPVS
jgi:hypothetical protein